MRSLSLNHVISTCVLLLASWYQIRASDQARAQSSSRPIPLIYEAEVEKQEGSDVRRGRLLYDRGKFRLELPFSDPPGSNPPKRKSLYEGAYLYDGSKPPVVWAYDYQKRVAVLDSGWAMLTLFETVRREGVAATRARYRIPPGYRFPPLPPRRGPPPMPQPEFGHMTLAGLKNASQFRSVGKEMVAGYACEIREGRFTQRDGEGGVVGTRTQRAWVEPRSGLVLRWEDRIEPPAGSPVPPMRFLQIVKRLRFLDRVPPERFQIPPGATARVPDLFKNAKLPKGVRRVRPTDGSEGIGVIFGSAYKIKR